MILIFNILCHSFFLFTLILFSVFLLAKQDVELYQTSTNDPTDEELLCQCTQANILTTTKLPINESTFLSGGVIIPDISPQEASACYMQAVVAPMSWTTLTTPGENNMDPGEYDAMVWAAKPALQDMPPSRLNLPREVKAQYMEKM